MASVGPSGVSGRSIAREADVHHAQIQQMFGSVDQLLTEAVVRLRNRYRSEVFGATADLVDPLALADHPLFWRTTAQVSLDPGPIDLDVLVDGDPIREVAERLAHRVPDRAADLDLLIAGVWVAAPLGVLVFESPLRRGLGIGARQWPTCRQRFDARLADLADIIELPQPAKHQAEPTSTPTVGSPPRSGDSRDRLVDAAEELMATRLETGVPGRELAAHAGVNYGLVNHYFGGKAAVFDEALVRLHQRFLADVLEASDSANPAWVHRVFSDHRPFFRAWAARLLGDRATPDFKLLGMERLVDELATARGIGSVDDPARILAVGDAMTAVALQLGWVLLRPLLAEATSLDTTTSQLPAVHRWLLTDPGSDQQSR